MISIQNYLFKKDLFKKDKKDKKNKKNKKKVLKKHVSRIKPKYPIPEREAEKRQRSLILERNACKLSTSM